MYKLFENIIGRRAHKDKNQPRALLDEIEKSVQDEEEEETTEIIIKWLNNLPVDLGFFYIRAILQMQLMKSLLNATPEG